MARSHLDLESISKVVVNEQEFGGRSECVVVRLASLLYCFGWSETDLLMSEGSRCFPLEDV